MRALAHPCVTRLADGAAYTIGDIQEVTQQAAFERSGQVDRIEVGWFDGPVLLNAKDEFELARLAWQQISPEADFLPPAASPIQCLLHARMTTSRFIYEMTRLRAAD